MPEGIESPGFDQAFNHPLVDDAQIHLFTEIKNRVESTVLLARLQNRTNGVFAHILDGEKSEAYIGPGGREVELADVDVGRENLDAHIAAFVDVLHDLV